MARYASDPRQSRGRLHDEGRSEANGSIRGPRDDFQRDRDRIIHSISFRRLRHKTQVFVSPDGDHFRVRLTHSLEVAQIGRTIARSLGLNEDLTEALCLAHDIGHPPFGHAGEDALEEALADHGGFDHNAQTIRTLTKLERPYPRWDGLNLTWEMLEGLAKHNGPIAEPTWAMAEANAAMALDLNSWPSLEAQIGRTIARSLGLNEDLTEALCLAHDIGHPPFGHAGEDALEEALADHGGFDHNAQTIRTLTKLERPYPRWDGLNLTWEMLEGLAKHNGPIAEPTWAMAEANAAMALDLNSWPSLEAQIAAVADDIAYDNHDIDDGLRAGLLSIDQLLTLPFIAERWSDICTRFPDVDRDRLVPELIRDQIGLMVNNVIETTVARIKKHRIETVDDVRDAGVMIGGFSNDMAAKERTLKKFMYANLYNHPEQMAAADNARVVVADLVGAYRDKPDLMPESWAAALPSAEPDRIRHIADFMAGMTDRYASNSHNEIFGDV